MTLAEIAGGFVVGVLFGIGAALFYLRWKMRRQLGDLEEQMGQMMDMTEDLDGMVPQPEERTGESVGDSAEE
ncbi:MAG: hypothetical protein ABEJ64_01555 [Candidatus Nanohaloarchaea archaeon]